MTAKTYFWSSIMLFAVALTLGVVSNFTHDLMQIWLVLSGVTLNIFGWVLYVIGWIKKSKG